MTDSFESFISSFSVTMPLDFLKNPEFTIQRKGLLMLHVVFSKPLIGIIGYQSSGTMLHKIYSWFRKIVQLMTIRRWLHPSGCLSFIRLASTGIATEFLHESFKFFYCCIHRDSGHRWHYVAVQHELPDCRGWSNGWWGLWCWRKKIWWVFQCFSGIWSFHASLKITTIPRSFIFRHPMHHGPDNSSHGTGVMLFNDPRMCSQYASCQTVSKLYTNLLLI